MRINPAARSLGRLALSALLLAAAACNDPNPVEVEDTGGDVEGSWAAVSFAGSPVPIQEYINDPQLGACLRELRGVDLTFVAAGTFTWVEEVFTDCALDSSPSTTTTTFTGTFRVEGIRLFMQDTDQQAEQEYSFTVANNMLTMRVKVGGITLASVFART